MFINQIRQKIGVMFGNPETTPGGTALKFYASMRLDIRKIDTLKEGQEATGGRVRVKVVKIRLRLHSNRQSLIFISMREFQKLVRFLILQ